jgi:hypothetical protein
MDQAQGALVHAPERGQELSWSPRRELGDEILDEPGLLELLG